MSKITRGTVTRVGGDDDEMRVEVDTGKDLETLVSREGQGNMIADFVTPGNKYVIETENGEISEIISLD